MKSAYEGAKSVGADVEYIDLYDIDLKGLLERVKKDKVKEIIFVTKSGIEADTTILYIKKCLEGVDVVISRVANGIPIGADMDYIDSLTLESALKNRKEVLD